MKQFFGALLTVVALASVSSAQTFFAGPSLFGLYFLNVNEYGSDVTLGFLSGQIGSYDLLGPLGA